jgi:hypothetical protein
VDIGVVLLVVIGNGLDDLFRLLRGGGVVEVDEGVAVYFSFQDWEVSANFVGV